MPSVRPVVCPIHRYSGLGSCPSCLADSMAAIAPTMSQEDVGSFYTRGDGSVWRLVGYAQSPTASLERVWPDQPTVGGRPERVQGVVGAPIFGGFRRLVPE